MSERATCWSITLNNPVRAEYAKPLPIGWKMKGQLERGKEGTMHYQGMLRTKQVRFCAVKREFPRAHIEIARNRVALAKYVEKEETRVATVESIPTLFEYQDIIAEKWKEDDFKLKLQQVHQSSATSLPDLDRVAMGYIDSLVEADIEDGRRGAEFIAINPMWRSSWLRFWRSIINRHNKYIPPDALLETEDQEESVQGSQDD